MKKWINMTTRWKVDFLIDCNILLLILFLLLLLKYLGIFFPATWPFIPSIIVFTNLFRRKSMFREVSLIMELLDIPLSELRMVLKVGRYDMMEWNDRKTIITLPKLYKALEYMEDQYFLAFHERFDEEKAIKKLAEKQFATNNTSVASD